MHVGMNAVVLVGGGGHARALADVASSRPECRISGYVDLEDRGPLAGIPYLGLASAVLRPGIGALIGVAYGKSPRRMIRDKVIAECEAQGCVFPSLASIHAVVSEGAQVGRGTVVMHKAIVNVGAVVGEFCVINTASIIEHDCRLGRGVFVGPGAVICGGAKIGANAFIGAGAVVRDAVSVVEGALVAAGAVVVSDLDIPGVYCGVPARLMDARRDIVDAQGG